MVWAATGRWTPVGVTGAPWASEIFNYVIDCNHNYVILAPVIIYHNRLSYEFVPVFYVLRIIFCTPRFLKESRSAHFSSFYNHHIPIFVCCDVRGSRSWTHHGSLCFLDGVVREQPQTQKHKERGERVVLTLLLDRFSVNTDVSSVNSGYET